MIEQALTGTSMRPVYIGLGSNLDDPQKQVRQALHELSVMDECQLLDHSSLYRSDPVGPQDQPDFINAVAKLMTSLSPEALLDRLQWLEQRHQRVRKQHWGPRTLDLDILLFEQKIIATPRLKIPPPPIGERSFVLYPLFEIDPGLVFPDGTPLSKLTARCPIGTLERLTSPDRSLLTQVDA